MEDGEGISETKDGSVEEKETIPSFLLFHKILLLCNIVGEEEWLERVVKERG